MGSGAYPGILKQGGPAEFSSKGGGGTYSEQFVLEIDHIFSKKGGWGGGGGGGGEGLTPLLDLPLEIEYPSIWERETFAMLLTMLKRNLRMQIAIEGPNLDFNEIITEFNFISGVPGPATHFNLCNLEPLDY